MQRTLPIGAMVLFTVVHIPAPRAWADVRPHPLIGEGMVLQQGRDVRLWGTADPDEKIVVRFRDQQVATTAPNGRWSVRLKSGAAGGPFPLRITGKNTLVFQNVLVGEVWLCSGQSNMGWPYAPRPGAKELQGTANPNLHLFTVPERLSDVPREDFPASPWLPCGPQSVGRFSAVAYYFGREVQTTLQVPVGLIHTSYGGSSVHQWMSPAAQEGMGKRATKPVLYNGMISPLVPYTIRGVLWYQGEADTGDPAGYRHAFPALIRGWRAAWGQGDFPFLLVQLAPYGSMVREPRASAWAELREAQRLTSLSVPGTGMAVITDYGHETDIHPKPKQPVGERLARLALGLVYERKIVSSGPAYAGLTVAGNKIVLTFRHSGRGLEARPMVLENVVTDARTGRRGGALHVRPPTPGDQAVGLEGFTIAGADGPFVNAQADIRGDQVVVWSPAVARPVAVRYAWADYPTGNLFNKDGLPASPFRTDEPPRR